MFVTKKKYEALFKKSEEILALAQAANNALVKKLEPGYVCFVKMDNSLGQSDLHFLAEEINNLAEKYYDGEQIGLLFIGGDGSQQKVLSKRKIKEEK